MAKLVIFGEKNDIKKKKFDQTTYTTWKQLAQLAFEAGWALRLKFIENFMENCIDAGLLHTNYRELTVNYHLIVSFFGPRFALKIFVMNFRVKDSLIFMCAAHGKKYGSFPLKKLQLSLSQSLLTPDYLYFLAIIQSVFCHPQR